MSQKDMELDVFERILDSFPPGTEVNLQGEGEPTLWPHLEYVLRTYGEDYKFFTITNGTRQIDISKFQALSISLDTLDSKLAASTGRANLDKVISNVLYWRNTSDKVITIMTVDFGQDLQPLKNWCQFFGLKHVIQPLQTKDDYVKVYPTFKIKEVKPTVHGKLSCAIGFKGEASYWDVDGQELPCCFTKDTSDFVDCSNVYKRMTLGITPHSCSGCQHLTVDK